LTKDEDNGGCEDLIIRGYLLVYFDMHVELSRETVDRKERERGKRTD